MRLVDLTVTLDPANREKLPPALSRAAGVVAPTIEYLHPAEAGGKNEFCLSLGCRHEDLPDGEGWGAERLSDMSTHCGTHVDAPLHSGSRIAGKAARTITDIGLEELYRPAMVLDVRAWAKGGEPITIEMLDRAIEAAGRPVQQGDAVLIRTGQERYTMDDREYFNQPGMSREGTLHLTRMGATVLGTDAIGWDLPFPVMTARFREGGDKRSLWDGHKAITEREAFIVQQLTNLGSLPLSGFHVGFFPIKLANCSAAPARVVAFVPE
ncbi:cyclase family protein [Caulobacter mirabilis]|uniref:Cyclase n=1 Tax=Caulobacter mirabilis TaxID=69666 RepID=A0A2D2AY65_9CAUL|nr:cyclase family protein [Caulobacter mirabilis]ATQ42923.1 cyclase [Caulobacter mirabilis]